MTNNILFLFGLILSLSACNKYQKVKVEISKHGGDDSHFTGRNCMDCHHVAGDGDGWFSLAGSTFGNKYKDGTINVLTKQGDINSSILAVEIDEKGNAYTTDSIEYSDGLYFAIQQKNDSIEYMESIAFTGQCNLCHGTTTELLK